MNIQGFSYFQVVIYIFFSSLIFGQVTTISMDHTFSSSSSSIPYGTTQVVSDYSSLGITFDFNLWDYTSSVLFLSVGIDGDLTNPAYELDSIQDNSYFTPNYGIGMIFGRGNRFQLPIKLSGLHHIKNRNEDELEMNKRFSSFALSLSTTPRIYISDNGFFFFGIEYFIPLRSKLGGERTTGGENFISFSIGLGGVFKEWNN